VTRHGTPIERYGLRDSVNTGISFSPRYEQTDACIAAGLDLWRWETGAYTPEFQALVVAWYRKHGEIALHSSDAVQRHAERKAKS